MSQEERLKIGAGFLGHLAQTLTVDDYVEAAVAAERAGLDSFWVADQRWMRDPWVTLTAIAEETDRMTLGTRITDPYIRHPAVTAVAAATLDERSGERFILGLGAGGSGFAQISLTRRRPVTALRETIDIIRQLWAGNDSPYTGKVVSWGGGTLGFDTRVDIPIVMATRGPQLLALAGEMTDGAIVASGTATSAIDWAKAQVHYGVSRVGRDPDEVELAHQTYVSVDDDDPGRAIQAAKKAIVGAVVGSFPTFDFLDAAGLEAPDDLVRCLEGGGEEPAVLLDLIPDFFVDKLCAAGSSKTVAETINAMAAAGVQHVLVAAIPSGAEGENGQLRRFLEDVLPNIR